MKIQKMELSWFRGAADSAVINSNSKSIVIYGDNRSGKSSFADAFEFLITKGKIKHLAHEYSDRDLRNCVRNTEVPLSTPSGITITFDEGHVTASIPDEERVSFSSDPPELINHIQSWNVNQHLLRQNEVSDFIELSKSRKYSMLSPLLGLSYYEQIAKNIESLKAQVESQSKLNYLLGENNSLQTEIKGYFKSLDEHDIKDEIRRVSKKYSIEASDDIYKVCEHALKKIEEQQVDIEPEIRRYTSFENTKKLDILKNIEEYQVIEIEKRELEDNILDHKINVLEDSEKIVELYDQDTILCPACGREMSFEQFKEHVKNELDQLTDYRQKKNQLTGIKRKITMNLSKINDIIQEVNFEEWLDLPENAAVKSSIEKIKQIKLPESDKIWENQHIQQLQESFKPILKQIEEELKTEPPKVKDLIQDRDIFRTALKIPRYIKQTEKITKIKVLISTLDLIFKNIRSFIAEVSQKTLNNISQDVRRIWERLHPKDPIEGISLEPSEGHEKAIDISLKFYGKDLASPRMTLSEGYRNSLGLSIFLAFANQGDAKSHPIILDDIVSSLDTNHRGMIVDLLNNELSNRQIILLTHDDSWYKRLLIRLDKTKWTFYKLLPWVNPKAGIRVTPTHSTFEEAQTLLKDNPRAAGNAVRAIMDSTLPNIAQKVALELPFIWGPKNDDRTNYDFLTQFISQGKNSYQIQNEPESWEIYTDAIKCWNEAKRLLHAWSNPPSHGGIIASVEVTRLIEVCESALGYFKCPECDTNLWRMKDGDSHFCRCSKIRWK